jgi:hypothetical protein
MSEEGKENTIFLCTRNAGLKMARLSSAHPISHRHHNIYAEFSNGNDMARIIVLCQKIITCLNNVVPCDR